MTITLPRWVLVAVAVAGVAVVAYLVGRGASDDEPTTPPTETTESLPCNQKVAERVAAGSAFAEEVEISGSSVEDLFQISLDGCADLTGDGIDEMVVRLHGGTGSAVGPLTIYAVDDGRWRPAIERMLSNNDLTKVTEHGIREVWAAYGPSEPACCPSGKRIGLISWDGQRFVYEPAAGIGDGRVKIDASEVVAIGPFQTQTGSVVQAIDAFGVPSSYLPSGELCEVVWEDIGLTINFVNLGGGNSCGSAGRVGSALLSGDHAEQATWTVASGLKVGSTQEEVRAQYPRMKPMPLYSGVDQQGAPGRDWSLVTRPNPYAEGERTVSLAVRLNRGEAVAYTAFVGAGGE